MTRSCRCSAAEGCNPANRRDFLKVAVLGATAATAGMSAITGLSEAADLANVAPTDKKLDPAWLKSLSERGEPTVYRGSELTTIGMPVGGICAGQLYLGGDGKLWHWDIFNQHVDTGCSGPHYASPPKPASPLEQGFGVRLTAGGKTEFRALDRTGFADVTFRGEYPIGLVEYRDPAVPIAVSLEAFSPFVPLDVDASSLPATILRFAVKNTGSERVEAQLIGWLENGVCLYTAKPGAGDRQNRVVRQAKMILLDCSVQAPRQSQSAVPPPPVNLEEQSDFGAMCLGLLEPQATDLSAARVSPTELRQTGFSNVPSATEPLPAKPVGALARRLSLEPGQTAAATFLLAWHFPNLRLKDGGRYYAARFPSAAKVAEHVADNLDSLHRQTRLWRDTWYDSTLPYWFLDRTFANTSILASSTCHRFKNGRFYGWEGVGCCEGTCTHVWHYAHAVARLFPELERDLRRRTDFGTAMDPKTGVIRFRGETEGLAVDGQAGCILRVYREHQMSADHGLLTALWPRVKLAMQCLIRMDDGQGLLAGSQHNTLDQPWFGKVAWLSSLYVAAARACEEMAREIGDEAFADQMRQIAKRGGKSIDRELFNGEYYIQFADKDHAKSVGVHDGCEIDQVFGQSWAYQVGLGRILDEQQVRKALASLWRYNFTPDVGPFRARNKPGRWYAMAGEGGLIMCTWPKGDARRVEQGYDYYFNECMTGFEYQVAGHMIWEGMVQEGLAIVRAIHDRYHASRRNPWNEVECGDHYARAMASYGVFLAACGCEYHGPKGHLAFSPRLSPNAFKAAFTTAEGWGTFGQRRADKVQRETIELKWGKLRLRSLAFDLPRDSKAASVAVAAHGKSLASTHVMEGSRLRIKLSEELILAAGESVEIAIGVV